VYVCSVNRENHGRVIEMVLPATTCRETQIDRSRRFHPSWMYCQLENCTREPVFIYGPRHPSDNSTLPTSLFLLPPGSATPRRWDCKGILIPSDRDAFNGKAFVPGPVALKYRDFRRVKILAEEGVYRCPRSDGFLPSSVVLPQTYVELLSLARHVVAI